MNQGTELGYQILADISGYTSYLADVELTHAQDILAKLLELIVERYEPPLTIAKLEGDAVFAYAPHSYIPRDETLLEPMESTYLLELDCFCWPCPANLHAYSIIMVRSAGIPSMEHSER